ncbi:MAG: peptidoglycan DD-metalloendopeptidase family protein [Oscillospiraceae bacterium]|nr:peptidoglycan DD-metalloendopeptidase family protein [Oscillospiraceae bacterium]
MRAPFRGRFRVIRCYSAAHPQLALAGIDSTAVRSTVRGYVVRTVREDTSDCGRQVVIRRDGSEEYYYFAELSAVCVTPGDRVQPGTVIGTGAHCCCACRRNDDPVQPESVSLLSGIPNAVGVFGGSGRI